MSLPSSRIDLDPGAARDLKKLKRTHPDIVARLIRLIDGLPTDPFQGKPLKGQKQGCYEVYSKDKVIHLIRVGHRRDIYR